MYQRKVDVDILNAVRSVLADVSSVSPSSEQGQGQERERERERERGQSQEEDLVLMKG